MLGSCVLATAPQIPKINLEYWRSYEDLEECMEPMKQLSLLLESSTEPTIHSTLGYFLRLLYEKLKTSPKKPYCSLRRVQYYHGHVYKEAFDVVGRCGAILPMGCGGYVGWEEDRF